MKDKSKKEVEIIEYSEKYYDDAFEYRHVIIPPKFLENDPITKLLEEEEWRKMGVVQSRGWVHYAIHRPEPHIMLFRRPRQDINADNPNPNSVN